MPSARQTSIRKKPGKDSPTISGIFLKALSSNLFLMITAAWFVIQAAYYAITVRFGFPPDETYHYNFIQLFAQHFPSPILHNQSSYPTLAESVHNPFFLYHYLFSFPYKLISGWDDAYIILRLLNITLALGSIYLIYRICKVLKVSLLVRNISIFMLTNTIMFTFLSASISYDNLLFLNTILSVYLLILLMSKVTATRLILFLIALVGGTMIVINFLPICSMLTIGLLYVLYKKRDGFWSKLIGSFNANKPRNYILIFVLLLLSGLFVQRYVFNVIQYHTYSPSCTAVRPISTCQNNSIYKRDAYIHGAGRQAAPLSPIKYAHSWGKTMKRTLYGIFAGSKKNFPPSQAMGIFIDALIVSMFASLVLVIRLKDRPLVTILIISIFYIFVLFMYNYIAYKGTGRESIAVQGRYVLPILPFLYILGNHSIEKILRKPSIVMLYAIVCIIFFGLSGLPHYLKNYSPRWHRAYIGANQLTDR